MVGGGAVGFSKIAASTGHTGHRLTGMAGVTRGFEKLNVKLCDATARRTRLV